MNRCARRAAAPWSCSATCQRSGLGYRPGARVMHFPIHARYRSQPSAVGASGGWDRLQRPACHLPILAHDWWWRPQADDVPTLQSGCPRPRSQGARLLDRAPTGGAMAWTVPASDTPGRAVTARVLPQARRAWNHPRDATLTVGRTGDGSSTRRGHSFSGQGSPLPPALVLGRSGIGWRASFDRTQLPLRNGPIDHRRDALTHFAPLRLAARWLDPSSRCHRERQH